MARASSARAHHKYLTKDNINYEKRPLHAAAEAGFTEMAKLLLECGAEIDALTNVNNTALQLGKFGCRNSSSQKEIKLYSYSQN